MKEKRVARPAETKRRRAAEKRGGTLWTKTALVAGFASILLGTFGWLWLAHGGGGRIQEKQLLQHLEELASAGEDIALLNHARGFLDDDANGVKNVNLDTGLTERLRILIDQSLTRVLRDDARDVSSYAALAETVERNPEWQNPLEFLGLLDSRLGLPSARVLETRLQRLDRLLTIEREEDPFRKAAHIARYLEDADPDAAEQDRFADVFREALDLVIKTGPEDAAQLILPLEKVSLEHAPFPGPLLDIALETVTLGALVQQGLNHDLAARAARALGTLLDTENELLTTEGAAAERDRASTHHLLNTFSANLRDAYSALRLHQLDGDARDALEEALASTIDRKTDQLLRLAAARTPELFEFLSLIAEVNRLPPLLDALLEEHALPIPSAYLHVWNHDLGQPRGRERLQETATRALGLDLRSIPHGRDPVLWEGFVRFIQARAHSILLQFLIADMSVGIQQGAVTEDEIEPLIRQIERHLQQALALRSGYTGSILRMIDNHVKIVGAHGEISAREPAFPPALESEIRHLAVSAFHSLPEKERAPFVTSLSPAERLELAWLLDPPASLDPSEWSFYERFRHGAALVASYGLPPFDSLDEDLRRRLGELFTGAPGTP